MVANLSSLNPQGKAPIPFSKHQKEAPISPVNEEASSAIFPVDFQRGVGMQL